MILVWSWCSEGQCTCKSTSLFMKSTFVEEKRCCGMYICDEMFWKYNLTEAIHLCFLMRWHLKKQSVSHIFEACKLSESMLPSKHNVFNHSKISSVHVPISSGLQCLLQGYSVNSIHPQHKAYSPLLKALGSKFSSGQEQGTCYCFCSLYFHTTNCTMSPDIFDPTRMVQGAVGL